MNDQTRPPEEPNNSKSIDELEDETGEEISPNAKTEVLTNVELSSNDEEPSVENNDLSIEPELTAMQAKIKEAKSLFILLIAVLAFRSTCFEPFRIPSGSMIPTLMIGDFILVNKMAYGFKLPFSDLAIGSINWDPIYLFGRSTPERGDVIVFKYPQDPATNYIKRLIGLPGDEIEIRNKIIYVNGVEIKTKKIAAGPLMADMDDKFRAYNLDFYDASTGDHQHIIQFDADNLYQNDFGPKVVPEGHYFVMGDNRDFSADSRSWGFVPEQNVKGKALLVWFSMIFPFKGDEFKFRAHRIGTMIDSYPQLK